MEDINKINVEEVTIPTSVSFLTKNRTNVLQFHVFKDKKKTDPVFVAFFIIGEEGEPQEAINQITKLSNGWKKTNKMPKVDVEVEMDTSYLVQQFDTEGVHDFTRPCKSAKEFIQMMNQLGIKKLLKGQRVIKRIEIPLDVGKLGPE